MNAKLPEGGSGQTIEPSEPVKKPATLVTTSGFRGGGGAPGGGGPTGAGTVEKPPPYPTRNSTGEATTGFPAESRSLNFASPRLRMIPRAPPSFRPPKPIQLAT